LLPRNFPKILTAKTRSPGSDFYLFIYLYVFIIVRKKGRKEKKRK